jgi:predicted amino acid racemase
LTPLDPDVEIIGASSDHLLLDLTKSDRYHVGDSILFGLDYGALLAASTGKYVRKEVDA